MSHFSCALWLLAGVTVAVQAQTFTNRGLVGVGRIAANTLDAGGADTLGGFFSGMTFDPASWSRSGTSTSSYTYTGRIYTVPDRGPGASVDYHPRRATLLFNFAPYYGSNVVGQTQLVLTNTVITMLTYNGGTNFTGADADDNTVTSFPQSASGSAGKGRRSLDPEGIALAADGTFYVCDEYGPNLYQFGASGNLTNTLMPPPALVPKVGGSYPRQNAYTEESDPISGRYGGRGLEGISLTPDGKQLVALLQSPTGQDGSSKNGSVNTRILVYNVDPSSPQYSHLVGEYLYQLSLNGNDPGSSSKTTPVNEILAINNTQFLVVEHDTRGLGGDSGAFLYKRVNVADISHATNIAGTGYDSELGAPGQTSLPKTGNPSGVTPAAKTALIDMLEGAQLGKYSLNTNASSQNQNTLPSSWEGLALVPVGDPAATNDYFLFVGNDNDFTATKVYANGQQVDSNSSTVDNLALVYRVTLPGATIPQPSLPAVTTGAASMIGTTGAQLNASVNPHGLSTTARFEYGTTIAYGVATPAQSAGASDSPVAVSATLTGLLAGTTYHYRIDATNLLGAIQGTDQIFTTAADPPQTTTMTATNVTSWSAVLTGTVNPNGLTTGWWFDFGPTVAYGFSAPLQTLPAVGSNVTVSFSVVGLAGGTTYHFRVAGTNSAGSTLGDDQAFTTAPFVDSDGDGIPDDYELAHGLDPNASSDAATDSDGDGMSNLQEHLAGTDPNNPSSVFEITSMVVSGADVVAMFHSVFGKIYQLQRTCALGAGGWSPAPGSGAVSGSGVDAQAIDVGGAEQPCTFYRVLQLP